MGVWWSCVLLRCQGWTLIKRHEGNEEKRSRDLWGKSILVGGTGKSEGPEIEARSACVESKKAHVTEMIQAGEGIANKVRDIMGRS